MKAMKDRKELHVALKVSWHKELGKLQMASFASPWLSKREQKSPLLGSELIDLTQLQGDTARPISIRVQALIQLACLRLGISS